MANRNISAADGAAITTEAKSWKGTPYALIGGASTKGIGGDCSGSTWRIYVAAGFSYNYTDSAGFPGYVSKSGRFSELKAGEPMQEGDILWWPKHMAVYSTFENDKADLTKDRVITKGSNKGKHFTQINDMWSATKPGGDPYGGNKMEYFRPGEKPRVFRYQK